MEQKQMTAEQETRIMEDAIALFGADAQIIKALEELNELGVELSRYLNNIGDMDKVREELADAFVMLNQLELIFGDVSEIEIEKLERLERRIYGVSV